MSTDNGRAGTARGCPRWIRVILILSLAVNLAIAGVVVGHKLRADSKHKRQGADRVIDWMVEMVPEERQDFARKHLSDLPRRLDSERAERITHLPEVISAMEAEPFDPDALDVALRSMSEQHHGKRTAFRHSLISLLEVLTPEERASFAENYRERLDSQAKKGRP